MNPQILIAYASKHGGTTEIAEMIGKTLQEAGLDVEVLPVEEVRNLSHYRAVVLGSAVYIGLWRKKAARFLKENELILAKKPVWIFSSGPTGEGNPEALLQGWKFPPNLQPILDRLKPRDIAVFGGTLEADRMSFWEKWIIKNVKAPVGDFRDWDAIGKWAEGIAKSLKIALTS